MRTVLIGIARMGSTRLPGKVMRSFEIERDYRPILGHIAGIGERVPGVDDVCIATSTLPQDDVIVDWCEDNHIPWFRGSETDVLSRFAGAVNFMHAEVAVRVTCDCPFLDPQVIGEVVALREATGADYASNIDPPEWPDGLDCEAITVEALYAAEREATRPSDRDTVTQWIVRNRHRFPSAFLPCPLPGMNKERWVLDTQEDWEFCEALVKAGISPGDSYIKIWNLLNKQPELRKINAAAPRNERYFDTLAQEGSATKSFSTSKAILSKTRQIIPLGAQTFSKSYLQYPEASPSFVTHGNGGYVYDVDGNEYVDLVGGLLPVILGHRDPDVDYAIRQQLARGTSLSLSTTLELQLAEKLTQLIPCAEMVRFAKNGTDVTTAAVRLARHVTGRSNILSQGYHGWADWSVCHDPVRNKGVPASVKQHTAIFEYGAIATAEKLLRDRSHAAVIVEPEGNPTFLRQLRELCDQTGTALIFDEIITGFRFDLGGAQKLYGVTPDIACFGKSMGNGMPIAAIVGKRGWMKHMETVCFSGTFFGETLSLAASIATIDKLERTKAMDKIHDNNAELINTFNWWSSTHLSAGIVTCNGSIRLPRLSFKDEAIKTLFIQEMIRNGVLIIASFNLSYAHERHHLERVSKALDVSFATIAEAIKHGKVEESIEGHVIDKSANVRA